MLDLKNLDNYFNASSEQLSNQNSQNVNKHSRFVRTAKVALPSVAGILIALLLVFPSLKKDAKEFSLDITRPKRGELEKLHVENTVFYITDKDNRVNNFVVQNIDETEPGSKLVKLTKPEGLLPMDGNKWVNIKSPQGMFNQTTSVLELQQNVEMFYNEGMTITTEQAFFDFSASKGYGKKPVKGDGFMGKIVSQGFEFLAKEHILTFTGNTNIIIKEESLKK